MSFDYDTLVDSISVMVKLETTNYGRFNYILEFDEKKEADEKIEGRIIGLRRSRVVNWMYEVVDTYGLSRGLVSSGMSLLDTFYGKLSKKDHLCVADFQRFQLVSLATFILALKLDNNKSLNIPDLCSGQFDISLIVEMEKFVLEVLDWNLHAPAPIDFVKYCMLLQCHCHHDNLGENGDNLKIFIPVYDEISDIAVFLTEIAELDYHFISFKASTIAFAAILNALEMIGHLRYPSNLCDSFVRLLEKVLLQNEVGEDVIKCRQRLAQVYLNSETGDASQTNTVEESRNRMNAQSPRGVFDLI